MSRRGAASGSVGVRILKDSLSAVLGRVRRGETVTVTDHNRPVALLVPVPSAGESSGEIAFQLASAGRVAWSGGKPRGSARPGKVRGRSVAEAVLEDRR